MPTDRALLLHVERKVERVRRAPPVVWLICNASSVDESEFRRCRWLYLVETNPSLTLERPPLHPLSQKHQRRLRDLARDLARDQRDRLESGDPAKG
jgi:hypothetical protein